MRSFKRKSFRSVATVFIALTAMMGSSSQAEAGLLGPSSDYIVQITPSARAAIETAIKNSGGTVNQRFQYAFDGFVIKLPDMLLPVLKKIPNILTIEKDQPVAGLGIQQNEFPTPSWGIDRIDQREAVPTDAGYQGNYGYRSAGAGATIYIGDTGIYPHEDLAGRISSVGFAGIPDGNGTVDCNGHGTHVATTAAGTKYGVAKNAKVVPVRILNCAGSGSYSTVIAGLDWILSPLNTNPKTQAVLNLSIGGGASSSINDAIQRLTNGGITVVAAAGNENTDACTRSPASAPSAITVGATTILDAKAYYSNYGPCVDIHAPGSGITGGWKDAANATNTISGTSMATPHVTGAAAVFLGLNPTASVTQVAASLVDQSTKGVVTGLPAATVNNLLYVSPTDGGPAITPPAIQIKTVTGITHLQATANIEINPNNAPTTASLEYSTTQDFSTIIKRIDVTPTPLDGGALISLPVVMDGLAPLTSYYFRATAINESGSFTSEVGNFKSIAAPVTPPLPIATNPTLVTAWSAHLNGTINANNGPTTVTFLYGTDPDFLNNTISGLANPQSVSGSTTTNVGLDISFLNGNTTYYYKLVGSNSAASVQSPVISFTTPAALGILASVETIRPTGGLNTPTTTITGRVNPNGQTTSVKLIWDVDSSMTIAPKSVVLPTQYTGIDTVTVTADMTGLTPGYRYYYRFEATNAAGISKPIPLTNVGNPVMPVIRSTQATAVTLNSMTLYTNVNAGASNIRISFIYGTNPNLDTATTEINGTPFALTNALNNPVTAALTGLKSNTTYYFRTKIFAYTGPLVDQGKILLGPIVSVQTPYPPRIAQSIAFSMPMSRFYGGAPTPLTATTSSGLPITYATSTPAVCQIVTTDSGPAVTYVSPVSTATSSVCTVTAAQGGDDTYSPAPTQVRSMTFNKEGTTITGTWAGAISVEGTTLNLNVNSVSQPLLRETLGGTTAFTVVSKTPTICKVENVAYVGSNVAHTSATVKALWNGSCQIGVTFAGNSYWLPTVATITGGISGMTTPEPGANVAQIITFPALPSKATATLNPLVATATSNLPVTFTSMTPATCTVEQQANGSYAAKATDSVSGDTTICTIKAEQAGNDRWAAAVAVSKSFIWVRNPQSITFTAPSSRYYGGAPTVLTATATSGLPVTFTSTTPTVCSVTTGDSGTVLNYVTPLPAATTAICSITASQAGDSKWAAAGSIYRSMTWMKESVVLRATWAGPVTVAGTAVDVTVKSGSQPTLGEDLSTTTPLVFTSLTPKVCAVDSTSYQGTSTSHTRAIFKAIYNGTCQYSVAFAGNSYWLPAKAIYVVSVTGVTTPQPGASAPQTINFAQPLNTAMGTNVALTVSASSALPVTVVATTPAVCSVAQDSAGKYVVSSVDGLTGDNNLCTLSASQAGNSAWAPATSTTRTFKFIRKAQAITFTLAPNRYFGGAGTPLVATASSGLPITFTTTTPTVCQVTTTDSGTVLNYTAIPTSTSASCYVVANQAGDGTFAPAPSLGRQILWQKEPTITRPTWSGAITTAGTTLDLKVSSAVQPLLGEFVGGTEPLTFINSTPSTCKITNTEFVGTAAVHTRLTVKAMWNGTCQLTARFAGNSYWLASSIVFTSTVSGLTTPEVGANAPQSIAMSVPAAIEIGYVAPFAPVATSKLPVTLTSLTPSVCVVTPNGSAYKVAAAPGVVGNTNTCSIQASQPGDDRWAPALTITRNINVKMAATVIRFTRTASTVTPTLPGLLVASTTYINGSIAGNQSIGHVATVTTSTPAVCSVTNVSPFTGPYGTQTQATVTAVANGICSVQWAYAGDATKLPAAYSQNITISGVK